MARIGRLHDDSRAFDLDFWDKVGAEGRFAAMWEMVTETLTAGHETNGDQLRLQRSVCRLVRRQQNGARLSPRAVGESEKC